MFKNIFGRKKKIVATTEQTDSKVLLAQLLAKNEKAGLGKLYPILKPADWVGRPHAVYIPWIGDEENAQVLIAFGFDAGENLTFLTNQQAVGMKKSEIYEMAIQNIAALSSPITICDVQGHAIATASGHDFAAEKIFDSNFLHELGAKLDSNELLISIPRRRCLMASFVISSTYICSL